MGIAKEAAFDRDINVLGEPVDDLEDFRQRSAALENEMLPNHPQTE